MMLEMLTHLEIMWPQSETGPSSTENPEPEMSACSPFHYVSFFFFLWCTHAARVEYQELKAPQHEWEWDTLSGWVHKSVRRRFQKLDASQDENMHMLHAIFWQGSIISNIQDVPFCLFLSQDDDHNLLGLVHILKPYTCTILDSSYY